MKARRWALWGAVLLIAVMGGCRREPGKAAGGQAQPVVRTAERGPVKLTVTCDKQEISIAERVTLSLKVEAQEGVEVTLPQFGQQLSDFQIRNFADKPPTAAGGVRTWEQVYDLDIFLSGQYTIPALTVKFADRRERAGQASAEPIEGEISSEPIPIEVKSLLQGELDPTKFRDIKGPVALPGGRVPRWVWWGCGALGVVVLGALGGLWVVRRRRAAQVPAMPPHEWAFDQLRALIDDQRVERGLVREFYYRLSEIIRVYIELRFGLMAPERTTEEFLAEVRSSPALSGDHKRLLADFLLACDMVKFARYQPGNEEIERVFHTARDFVDQTARRKEPEPLEAAA